MVTGSIVDSTGEYDFLNHVKEINAKLSERWLKEIKEAFNTMQRNNEPVRSSYSPGEEEDDHGHLCIVVENLLELNVCLIAMAKAHVYAPRLHVTTRGHATDNTASVEATLYDRGSLITIRPPADTPTITGLQAAKKLIQDEIVRIGGDRGY